MPVTLQEASKNTLEALQMGIIDEFRKSSFLLDNLTFDNSVSPVGGGTTMTYSYTRLETQPTAQFREVNTEYTPHEVTKTRHSVDLKIFGGSYQIDRVIKDLGGIVNEVTLQSTQKVKAAVALFNDTVINGDAGVDAKAFDGLEVALAGSSTEWIPAAPIDLSSAAAIDSGWAAFQDEFEEFLMTVDGGVSVIMANKTTIAKIQAVARRAGQYQVTKDNFGRQIGSYNGIPLVDLGAKSGSNDPVIPIAADGTTSIYVARLALDGFHAVSTADGSPIKTWLPDYTTAGAVKTGEVEMLAAVALKATKSAAVMRNVKVKA